ncbi:hypothetical protein EJB05_26933, partial [Eragrostis curvula]
MAIQRSQACCLFLALLLSLQLTGGLAGGASDVTVYWGRNKYEGSLRETCDTGLYKTVIISFLSAFGHGQYKLDLSGHPPFDIGNDINYCKSKGIVILLAIGGQGGEYSLPSSQAAAEVADYLWNAFLGGSRRGLVRPFGNVAYHIHLPSTLAAQLPFSAELAPSCHGRDVNSSPRAINNLRKVSIADTTLAGLPEVLQSGKEHYDELARRLFDYTKYYRLGRVVLTATPRCGYLDHRLEAALDTGLFDRIHVRLYGEEGWCFQTPLESFKKWAVAYPHSKVSVGVVASPDAAGYMPPWDLYYRVLEYAKKVSCRPCMPSLRKDHLFFPAFPFFDKGGKPKSNLSIEKVFSAAVSTRSVYSCMPWGSNHQSSGETN